METILAITNNMDYTIKLIKCKTNSEANELMRNTYKKICEENNYDLYNTFYDEESGYAQIVSGFKLTEMRIGTLSTEKN